MKKIVFGITSLNQGGAERVLIDIVNKLSSKFDITIFTLYGNNDFSKQLNEKVHEISMYKVSRNELNIISKKVLSLKLSNSIARKKIYDKFIRGKFDVVVSFLEGPVTWIFATPEENVRKIAWVHNDIEQVFGIDKHSSVKQKINESSYNSYDELIFVSNDNKKKFESFFKNNSVKKEVIYNYLDISLVKEKAKEKIDLALKKDLPTFVQVSRLVDQKAVSRLIKVHASLIKDEFLHRIYIVGDGPLKEDLNNLIKELNVEDTFILLGGMNNPYPVIKEGDYFMLTSYYEGFPMVLLEAKALNKYILITDTAARETLINYKDSKVVKNSEEGIYEGIKSIVKSLPKANDKNEFNTDDILEKVRNVIEGK